MSTNFFQQIKELNIQSDLQIVIKNLSNGNLAISVFLKNEGVEDEAHKMIPPMNLRGTPEELDAGFFENITQPAQQTDQLFTNMQQYQQSLEEARQKSQAEQNKRDNEKKEKDTRKKKYEEQMKKVKELEEKEKYGEAIGAMPKPEDFPEHTEEIKNKLDELRQKHGQLSLL